MFPFHKHLIPLKECTQHLDSPCSWVVGVSFRKINEVVIVITLCEGGTFFFLDYQQEFGNGRGKKKVEAISGGEGGREFG